MEDLQHQTSAAPISLADVHDGIGNKHSEASGAISGMEGGAGKYSYSRNSRVQSQAVDFLTPILVEEIGQLSNLLHEPGTVIRVADLGCSVGANTLAYADALSRSIQASFQESDIQYYFSDLPSNDFNTLFRQLEQHGLMKDDSGSPCGKKFYAAAAPGSFYGRLFPTGQLHVVISIFALQWLSEIPPAVKDKTSPAYNKGRAWIQERSISPAVVQAFAQTSKRDLHNFFHSRALEVASGGLLVIGMAGRSDDRDPVQQCIKGLEYANPFGPVFEQTWKELADEGTIDKEAVDGFNVPVFFRSLDEVRDAVESTQAFHIKRLLIQDLRALPEAEEKALLHDPEAYSRFLTGFGRSMIGSYVEAHLGQTSADKFFECFSRRAAMATRERKIPRLAVNCLLVVLVRK